MGCALSTECEPTVIKPKCDGFRVFPLRFLGYATHIGSACSALIPAHLQHVPTMITTAYICADIFHKARQSAQGNCACKKKILIDAADAAIWQMLASVVIPGLIVKKLKDLTVQATTHSPTSCKPPPPLVKALPPSILKALPCIVGVLSLPLIIYPIDKIVTLLMDTTYRKMTEVECPGEKMERKEIIKKLKKQRKSCKWLGGPSC